MGQPRPPMARTAPRPLQRWLQRTAAAIALSLGLSGCSTHGPLPAVLYVAISVSKEESISPELVVELQAHFRQLEAAFRHVYPQTSVQFNVYSEDRLLPAIRARTQAGLGPDLLLVNGETARHLLREHLSVAYPASTSQLTAFDPAEVRRLRTSQGGLIGLPLLVQTQMACFNRQVLPEAPATVTALLTTSAAGHPIGVATDLASLFWSAGSLGAIDGINQALAGEEPSPKQRAGIERWLAWLQDANSQQRVMFYTNQPNAELALSNGRLDWIPCRSTSLPSLSQRMGARLGVAPLPDGDGLEASPINELRLLVLSRNASPAGRARALAFGRLAMNPLIQRNITVNSKTFLPANIHVHVPVMSSSVLAAMETASVQGRRSNQTLSAINRDDARVGAAQELINSLVFGEISPRNATTALIRVLRRQP